MSHPWGASGGVGVMDFKKGQGSPLQFLQKKGSNFFETKLTTNLHLKSCKLLHVFSELHCKERDPGLKTCLTSLLSL